MAESLASLPFKSLDEVLFILMKLSRLLSVDGVSHLDVNSMEESRVEDMARIVILSCLKIYLKNVYGINERYVQYLFCFRY